MNEALHILAFFPLNTIVPLVHSYKTISAEKNPVTVLLRHATPRNPNPTSIPALEICWQIIILKLKQRLD